MKRLLVLLLLPVPYWLWLNAPRGTPHLSLLSPVPFVYAVISLAVFLPLSWWLFHLDDDDRRESVTRVGFGAIGGIGLVYFITAAMAHPGWVAAALGGPVGVAIGAASAGSALMDVPSLPLWVSIVGYTLGVGLVEELSKAVAARPHFVDGLWSRAAFGFVAGIGFGVGEALIYSYREYAGVADWPSYVIRFVFCVGSHGCMSTVAVLSLPEDWWDFSRWPVTVSGSCRLPPCMVPTMPC